MTKQIINIGTSANKGNGDPLRTAFAKVNANFDELYTALGLNADGTLSLGAFEFTGSVMTTTDSTAITIDQATTVTSNLTVGGDILPSLANGGNLGSLAAPWRSLYVSNNTMYLGGIPLSLDANNNLLVNNQPVTGGGGSSVTTSATAPVGPSVGDLWYDTASGRTYVYYDSSWVDASPEDGTGTQTDLGNWAFRNDLMYSLNGGVIENSDLTHGATAGLTIPTNGDDSPIVLTNAYGNVALVSGASPGALKTWSFGTEGKLTLPAGTTFEYLNVPLTGHGDGLARLDFGLVTDGVSAQWIAASADPAGSGYSPGDTFTFNAAFLGIPGASVTIEVVTVGAGGSVEDLAFSTPPRYPADIYRDSPINLQVGPESNRWTFDANGKLTTPGDIQLSIDSYLRFPDNSFQATAFVGIATTAEGLSNAGNATVVVDPLGVNKVWTFDTTGTLSLPAQATPILTADTIVPTPKIYRATSSNDAAAINAAQASWYDVELTYIDIRDQDEIEKEYTYPWSGLPSWEAQELLADWNVNRPDGAPNPNPALSPALTNAVNAYLNWKELESNIDIVLGNKTFRFSNNGNLSLPGEITFTNTTNAKIVVGANPSPYEGTPTPVSTWTFGVGDGNGSITFPNGSVQTTAYTSTPFDKLVNGSKEVVLGSDGVLTIPQQGKLSVAGITAVNLASLETAYNDAEALYSAERTTWMTVNNHIPRWYLLSGLVAYNEILDAAYTEPDWTGTATLTSRALAATTAYNTWQTAINNSKLTVKSDASAWTFNSENKLTLSQGGVISGGDPVAIAAANNARAAEQSDWYYVITTAGADENIRPWHFAGASKDERLAVTTAMWQAQQTLDPGDTLGWQPISAALYNQVRSWIALNSSSDDYTEWKKLTTSVNITSEDNTWTFTNDGRLTVPGAVAALVDEDLALVTSYTPLTSPPGLNPPVDNFFVFGANGELTLPGGITKGLDEDFVITTSFTAMVSPPGPVSTVFTFGANGTLTIPDQILGTTNLTLRCAAGQTTSIEAGVGGSIEIGYQPSPPANIYIGTATSGYTTTTNIQSDRLRVLVDAPTTSKGQSGDVIGLVAFSSTHIYYCTADYTDGLSDIWKRVELTGGAW